MNRPSRRDRGFIILLQNRDMVIEKSRPLFLGSGCRLAQAHQAHRLDRGPLFRIVDTSVHLIDRGNLHDSEHTKLSLSRWQLSFYAAALASWSIAQNLISRLVMKK